MKTITKTEVDNIGGVLNIWAIPPGVCSFSGNILTVSSETNVIHIVCQEESIEFASELKEDAGGIYYEHEISGILPRIDIDNEDYISELEQQRWVVLFEDGNNNYQVAGNALQRLRFATKKNSGKQTADLNALSFRFWGKTTTDTFITVYPFGAGSS